MVWHLWQGIGSVGGVWQIQIESCPKVKSVECPNSVNASKAHCVFNRHQDGYGLGHKLWNEVRIYLTAMIMTSQRGSFKKSGSAGYHVDLYVYISTRKLK